MSFFIAKEKQLVAIRFKSMLFGIHASWDIHLSQIEQFATVQLFSIQHQFLLLFIVLIKITMFTRTVICLQSGWHIQGLPVAYVNDIDPIIFLTHFQLVKMMMWFVAIIRKTRASQQRLKRFGQFVDDLKVNFSVANFGSIRSDMYCKHACMFKANILWISHHFDF